MNIPHKPIFARSNSDYQAQRLANIHSPVNRAIVEAGWLKPELVVDEIRREGLPEYSAHLGQVRAWKGESAVSAMQAKNRIDALRAESLQLNNTLDAYASNPPHFRDPVTHRLVLNSAAIERAKERRSAIAEQILTAQSTLKTQYAQVLSLETVEARMAAAIELFLRQADSPEKPAEQPAPTPQINVTVAMPEVQRMEIVSMPDRETTTSIRRDALQQIVESTQVEKDAP